MAIRAKKLNKRAAVSEAARLWLDGQPCGFFKFKHQDELASLFEDHGDSESMYWHRGMSLPITREDLESREDAWLNSGEDDPYGSNSYFVDKYYSDEEKAAL